MNMLVIYEELMMKIRRMDQSENIKKAGYEINHEAKKLENIYKEIYYSTR